MLAEERRDQRKSAGHGDGGRKSAGHGDKGEKGRIFACLFDGLVNL